MIAGERGIVYLPLCKVADTFFHIKGGDMVHAMCVIINTTSAFLRITSIQCIQSFHRNRYFACLVRSLTDCVAFIFRACHCRLHFFFFTFIAKKTVHYLITSDTKIITFRLFRVTIAMTPALIFSKVINAYNCLSNFYINPFKPEFTIVIFIHYRPRIAVAFLDL